MSFCQKLCCAPFAPVSCSFPEPQPDPQCCLYNIPEGQPENSWPLGGKYYIISNPSRYSGFHLPCFLRVQQQHLSVNPLRKVGDRHTMPATSPSVGNPSRATGLPGIMFATLGVSPAGRLGRNPYYSSKSCKHIPGSNLHSTFMEHLVCCLLTNLFLSRLLTL